MPDSDGSAKAEASPVASPAASPQPSTRGPPAPYPQIPAPNFEGPSPRPNSLHRPARTSMLRPQPRTGPQPPPQPGGCPEAIGTKRGLPPARRPRARAGGGGRWGRPERPHPHAGDGAARRPPGKDKGCSATSRTVPGSPHPPPRWPPTPPPLCPLRGPGLHRPDGFREEKASL